MFGFSSEDKQNKIRKAEILEKLKKSVVRWPKNKTKITQIGNIINALNEGKSYPTEGNFLLELSDINASVNN